LFGRDAVKEGKIMKHTQKNEEAVSPIIGVIGISLFAKWIFSHWDFTDGTDGWSYLRPRSDHRIVRIRNG
jgi:hypothetical protein